MIGLAGRNALVASGGSRFGADFASALAAVVAVSLLSGRHEPETAACLAKDGGTQQPFVESYLFFNSHVGIPLFAHSV